MNKKSKKLQLHRETLHKLAEGTLKEVIGGATVARTCDGYTAAASCDCSLPPTWACNCG